MILKPLSSMKNPVKAKGYHLGHEPELLRAQKTSNANLREIKQNNWRRQVSNLVACTKNLPQVFTNDDDFLVLFTVTRNVHRERGRSGDRSLHATASMQVFNGSHVSNQEGHTRFGSMEYAT